MKLNNPFKKGTAEITYEDTMPENQFISRVLCRGYTREKAIIFSIVILFLLIISAYTGGMWDSIKKYGFVYGVDRKFSDFVVQGLFSSSCWIMFAALMITATIVWYIIRNKNDELYQIKGRDTRGVNFSEKGTYGTAEWMTRKEAKETFEVGHIDDVNGAILGQYTVDGLETISLPIIDGKNNNILILGKPGSGKSWCFIRNAVFQAAKRNENMVITDTKGDIYRTMAPILRDMGYDILVYNLVNPERSDAWDCVSEIYDTKTGDINDTRVTDFVDIVMKNTVEGPDDHFWGTGESNLFKAILMFCAWNREQSLKMLYEHYGKQLMLQLDDVLSSDDIYKISEILEEANTKPHMKDRQRALKILIKAVHGADKVDEMMEEIDRQAPPCDISSIYYLLITSDINELDEKFKPVPISHPAGISWSIFKNSSANTQPGIVQGLAQRLQLFQNRDIRRIATNKGIVFEELSEPNKKIALFCVISDNSSAMKALTSLFFTFLFKDVSDIADKDDAANRKAVNVIGDEFKNLGVIPNFDRTISTVRSRKINIYIVLQNITQLNDNYGENAAETIINCCDTVLFLGCNDLPTATYISNLSGVSSIRVLSTRDSRNTSLGNRTLMQGYSIGEGDGKRNLLNPDEVLKLPMTDVLIYHNGHNILQAKRCGYTHHSYWRNGKQESVSLKDYPLASIKYQTTEDLDAFVQADVDALRSRNKKISINNSINKSFSAKEEPANPISEYIKSVASNKKEEQKNVDFAEPNNDDTSSDNQNNTQEDIVIENNDTDWEF